MDKFKEIRPIVLGISIRDNKLLVSEGYDKVKKQTFYRCLGGGIEFQETSADALKREFMEELGINIEVGDFLTVLENIFTFESKPAHELVLFYNIKINDKDVKDEYHIMDEEEKTLACWVNIDEFKNGNKILYPTEIIKYL
ncbi:MAG: NUDIX domain-containing protein [Bacilli bacterium]|nr:NUDIX domain-containing protein [Bacilli bacterium]